MMGTRRWVWGFVVMAACAMLAACGGSSAASGPGEPEGRYRNFAGYRLVKWRGKIWVEEGFKSLPSAIRNAIVADVVGQVARVVNNQPGLDEDNVAWVAIYDVRVNTATSRPYVIYFGKIGLDNYPLSEMPVHNSFFVEGAADSD